MRKTCLDMVYRLARQDPRIVFIGSDLGFGTLDAFAHEMPERFFKEGISEANIVGLAAGLAMEGKIPYVNTIASFLTRRAYEQIVIDLCLHNLPVRLIGNGGGTVYAPLGPTHQILEDFAILRSLPNISIVAPADAGEMERFMPHSVDFPGPMYIRLAKGYDPIVTPLEPPFEIGKGQLLRKGRDALIVTTGVMLGAALSAAEMLMQLQITTTVLHFPTLKPFDEPALHAQMSQVRAVVSVEEHCRTGGLGSQVAEIIAEANLPVAPKFKRMGTPDCFPDRYGSQADLMNRYGLTSENIAETVRRLMNG